MTDKSFRASASSSAARHSATAGRPGAGSADAGQLSALEARHRADAGVEVRIRWGKHTGLGRFPSRMFVISAVWLELALTACDLIAWAQSILLQGELARCEPKTVRCRLLHVGARVTRGGRRVFVRIAEHWPWRYELAAAFSRLVALPKALRTRPATHRCPLHDPRTRSSRHEHAGTIRTPPNQIPDGNPTNKIINNALWPLLKGRG